VGRWLDLRDLDIPVAETGRWLGRAGVALSPGHWFGREGAGFARMTTAVSTDRLLQAADRLARAADETPRTA
jgi:bifunctional pyridoxal-dependent enzyme with beta-cystathionase and maltose regulon repressor activities